MFLFHRRIYGVGFVVAAVTVIVAGLVGWAAYAIRLVASGDPYENRVWGAAGICDASMGGDDTSTWYVYTCSTEEQRQAAASAADATFHGNALLLGWSAAIIIIVIVGCIWCSTVIVKRPAPRCCSRYSA